MASFTFEFSADLESQMLALEKAASEGAIAKMLEAGGKEVEAELKKQCRAHQQTGSMVKGIKATMAKKNDKGHFVVVRPTGKDVRTTKKGKKHVVRNMEKLAYLHYGTSKQPATGIVTKTISQAQAPALSAMQKVYDAEVGTG